MNDNKTPQIKVIKKADKPQKKVTDQTDLDVIRHAKTVLAKIYAKYGLDWRQECIKNTCNSA